MVDETRKEEVKRYQRSRAEARRTRKLTSRTLWIRAEDIEAFQEATAVFADHARLIEGVTGGTPISGESIIDIVKRHQLPYDPEDLIYLSRVNIELSLKPAESTYIENKTNAILQKYSIPVSLDEILGA